MLFFIVFFSYLKAKYNTFYLKVLPVTIGNSGDRRDITLLETLDDFSLMCIFDALTIRDLAALAQLSPRIETLIIDHYITYKHHLNTREIHISVAQVLSMYYKFDDNSNFAYIANMNNVLPTLKVIGPVLSSISIQIMPDGFRHIERLQFLINNYCSNAFQTISLKQYGSFKLKGVKVSFLNASNVFLHHNHFGDIAPLRLDEAFPRMEKLTIGRDTELKRHNPKLTELIFDQLWRIRSQPDFLNFLRLNPQLRSLEVPCLDNAEFLSSVGEALPNLESLSIRLLRSDYSVDTFPIVRFKHVKRFTLKQDLFHEVNLLNEKARELVASIQFDRLESFTVLAQTIDSHAPIIEMILKNPALQHLMINSEFLPFEVSTLITALTELKAMSIVWINTTQCHRLGAFLQQAARSNELGNFTVSFAENSQYSYKDLVPYLGFGWRRRNAVGMENSNWLYLHRST